jgi:NADH-quinone oxidoreductase subunit A
MTLLDYLPVLIQIIIAIGMGLGILFASHLFGQKATAGKIKDSPYECGLAS